MRPRRRRRGGAASRRRRRGDHVMRGASWSLDSVRMAPKSKKKPPTAFSHEDESRRWRETATKPRDAEIHTLAIIFLAGSQPRPFLPAPLTSISNASVTLSTPLGGFAKDFNSVTEALSRQLTASFAASNAGCATARSDAALSSILRASCAAASARPWTTLAASCSPSAMARAARPSFPGTRHIRPFSC